jgi:hypothetical protein
VRRDDDYSIIGEQFGPGKQAAGEEAGNFDPTPNEKSPPR